MRNPRGGWGVLLQAPPSCFGSEGESHSLRAAKIGTGAGERLFLCTQNVYDLHEQAASRNVHRYGRLLMSHCEACDRTPFQDANLFEPPTEIAKMHLRDGPVGTSSSPSQASPPAANAHLFTESIPGSSAVVPKIILRLGGERWPVGHKGSGSLRTSRAALWVSEVGTGGSPLDYSANSSAFHGVSFPP
jgi:hypothetical protein